MLEIRVNAATTLLSVLLTQLASRMLEITIQMAWSRLFKFSLCSRLFRPNHKTFSSTNQASSGPLHAAHNSIMPSCLLGMELTPPICPTGLLRIHGSPTGEKRDMLASSVTSRMLARESAEFNLISSTHCFECLNICQYLFNTSPSNLATNFSLFSIFKFIY